MLIPRIFHQIWVGPDPYPKELEHYRQGWLDLNPGWELRFWTEGNLPGDLRCPEARERLRVPAERADILRLEVLWREGGVYVGTDFECLRPIEPLIENLDFFATYRKLDRVNNALIGSVPGHPILDRALNELTPTETFGYDESAAGPVFLGRLLREYPAAKVFEAEVFYPQTLAQRDAAYAAHHEARSWNDADGLRVELAKLERLVGERQAEAFEWKQRYKQAQAELERLESGPGSSPLTRARRLIARK